MLDFLLALIPVALYGSVLGMFIWALVDAVQSKNANKALWIVVIIGIPLIGPLGYLIGGRKQ